jgi:hypothetical protein
MPLNAVHSSPKPLAARPGREERVQVSLSVMSYFFVLEDGVH